MFQVKENQSYVTMIEHVLNTPNLYFSYTYDLTHTLQRLHNTMPEFLQVHCQKSGGLKPDKGFLQLFRCRCMRELTKDLCGIDISSKKWVAILILSDSFYP